jgi:cytochrome b subunit of formate dehydrogenase
MDFGLYTTFFLLSTIKFLFAPFGGPMAGLSFLETYVSCVAGGIFSAAVFYYASEYFMKRTRAKRLKEREEALKNGTPLKVRKNFTKINKFVVRIKRRFGIYGISLFAPLFLSVPIGSIITAKFYGKEKRTFFLIVCGMFMNGFITTGLAYFGHSLF